MTLTVLAPGPLTTVQDLGRPGLAAQGIGRSGAADRASAALANRLLGNPADAAVLEVTAGGLAVRADVGVWVALTGARCPGAPYAAPTWLTPGRSSGSACPAAACAATSASGAASTCHRCWAPVPPTCCPAWSRTARRR